MPSPTTRLGLDRPLGADNPSELRTAITANSNTLDNAALYTEGTLAGIPAIATVEHGHIYRPTDVSGIIFVSDGTSWQHVTLPLSGTAGSIPSAAQLGRQYFTTDTGEVFLDTGSAWTRAIASRGATNIVTSQSISSTSYTTLGTPDQVTGIVLPTNGLIAVWYQATWNSSSISAGSAAIFLGANQLTIAPISPNTGPVPQFTSTTTSGGVNAPLSSHSGGLLTTNASYTGDVTTGQLVGVSQNAGGIPPSYGGPCYIFALAGTYTVSVQYKASSGTVTASNRRLWVQALPFA